MIRQHSLPFRGLVTCLASGLLLVRAVAGDVTGVVSDPNSKGFLSGASVLVVESNRAASTDSEGRFRLTGLAAGSYTLDVQYLGYEGKQVKVTVPASGDVETDVALEAKAIQLGAVVIEGYREGRSRALQQKRTQANILDIISADAIGNLPDRNVAEAIARAPGVSITGMEQGEGRYVSIRGIDPNLNQVMMDGAILAAPGGSRLGRAVPLDTLGAGDVSQVEVVKAVTPDLDANSLGGTINIKSSSAFDRRERFLSGSVSVNHNDSSDKNNLEAKISYSDLFGPQKKWGIAVSTSYEKREYSNHWLQTSWNLRNLNGSDVYLPNGFEIKPEEGEVKRMGGNLALEFRPDANTQFYFRPSYSSTVRNEHTVEVLHSVSNSNTSQVQLTGPNAGRFIGNNRTERRDFNSRKEQELLTLIGGFKKVFGDFTLEPMIALSAAEENTPFNNVLAFRNANGATGPITFDANAFDFVRWDVDPAVDTPNKYPLRRTREDTSIIDEDTLSAKVDLRWNIEDLTGRNSYLKTGFKYIQRDRISDFESKRLVPVGNWNLSAVSTRPSVGVYDNRYQSGFLIDPDATWTYIRSNPALTVLDPVDSTANSVEDDYDIDEYIYAAYAMGSVDFGKLTVLGGLRWEKTDATIRAVEVRTFRGQLLGRFPKSGVTSYDKVFPNLQAVYRFNDRLIGRAAITQVLGRPAYEDARPLARFTYDLITNPNNPTYNYSGTLNVGNPDLGPYEAVNFDLSLEYYLQGRGLFSIAAYRKEIDNPIYSYTQTQENVIYSGIGLQSLGVTSVRNADSGRIAGLEINLYQPFSFLPAPFDGFGIDANVSLISSEVKVPLRPNDDLPFLRQPSRLYNVTLFYEKAGFSGRVAWSYADESIETIGADVLNDRYRVPRDQVDVLFRYRINGNYAVTAAVRNLTEEPEQRSTGVFHLMQYSRLLGRDFRVGLDFNF
ncbi:MAG: TonB-dependent receptor [Opitutaceae bacterium]|nr:TonB-dependent receptor [Opitutaceae bacterium]